MQSLCNCLSVLLSTTSTRSFSTPPSCHAEYIMLLIFMHRSIRQQEFALHANERGICPLWGWGESLRLLYLHILHCNPEANVWPVFISQMVPIGNCWVLPPGFCHISYKSNFHSLHSHEVQLVKNLLVAFSQEPLKGNNAFLDIPPLFISAFCFVFVFVVCFLEALLQDRKKNMSGMSSVTLFLEDAWNSHTVDQNLIQSWH